MTDEIALIQTIDIFTPVVDDPYIFGQVAAANALSDVYAMGGKPLTALNFIGYPKDKLELDIVVAILKGGSDKADESGALIVGGHSIMDPELKYGLSVTGIVHPEQIVTNAGAQPGDNLILTKPVGTGILSTALKVGKASTDMEKSISDVMTTLNKTASEVMLKFQVHACTDITGYGLLGHSYEMASGSGMKFKIHARAVPTIPGTREVCKKGTIPGGAYTNGEFLEDKVSYHSQLTKEDKLILLDPQTSGGLLIAVPDNDTESLLNSLHESDVSDAVIIGEVQSGHAGTIEVVE